ncbi:hypothetical protein KDA23_04155, partial [Candidatus Saccharibacteria bacterium]|nr:hypothetical protein [Candidatus Saccharibacteria bacterium]
MNYSVTHRILKLFLMVVGLTLTANAGERYSGGSGNWNGITWYSNQARTVVSVLPGANDTVYIGNNDSVSFNLTTTIYKLVINDDATSAILEIGNNATARTLTINSALILNSGGTIQAGGTSTNHTISVGGDLQNSGNLDCETASAGINITFGGGIKCVISGSGTWDTRGLTFNKSAASDSVINRSSAFSQSVDGSYSATWTRGIYSHEVTDTVKMGQGNTTISANMTINMVTGGMYLSDGTVTATPTTTLQGTLKIQGGQVNVSYNNTATGHYQALDLTVATSTLVVTGGTLNIGGTTEYGNLRLANPSASVTINGASATVNAQRYVQNPGSAGASFTISAG